MIEVDVKDDGVTLLVPDAMIIENAQVVEGDHWVNDDNAYKFEVNSAAATVEGFDTMKIGDFPYKLGSSDEHAIIFTNGYNFSAKTHTDGDGRQFLLDEDTKTAYKLDKPVDKDDVLKNAERIGIYNAPGATITVEGGGVINIS